MALWHGNAFHQWIPSQRDIMQRFGVSFVISLNKLLNKQSVFKWFECRDAHMMLLLFPDIFILTPSSVWMLRHLKSYPCLSACKSVVKSQCLVKKSHYFITSHPWQTQPADTCIDNVIIPQNSVEMFWCDNDIIMLYACCVATSDRQSFCNASYL